MTIRREVIALQSNKKRVAKAIKFTSHEADYCRAEVCTEVVDTGRRCRGMTMRWPGVSGALAESWLAWTSDQIGRW
jgi:hypothetical protein